MNPKCTICSSDLEINESKRVVFCRFCDRKPSQLVQLFDELSKSGIMLPPTSYQEWLNQKGDRQ